MASYFKQGQWSRKSPVGGEWDIEQGSNSVRLAFGVDGFTAPQEQIIEFDERYDDAGLSTGVFRQFGANQYYYVVME